MTSRRRTTAPLAATDSTSFLSDPELAHLSSSQRDRLNDAFDRAGESKAERHIGDQRRRDRKRRKLEPEPQPQPQPAEEDEGGEGGGGFIVDEDMGGGGFLVDDEQGEGGGFLLDDDNGAGGGGFLPEEPAAQGGHQELNDVDMSPPPSPSSTRTHLPLSLIPSALTLVGLPSSDSEVLDFFKQSAEGWDGALPVDGVVGGIKEKGVSRRDWFAVCAILLSGKGGEEEEEEEEEEENQEMGSEGEVQQEEEDEDEEEEDRFSPEEEDEDEEDGGFVRDRPSKIRVVRDEDEDEFDLHNSSRRRTRRTTRANPNEDSPVPSLPSSPSTSDTSSSRPRTKKAKGASKAKKKQAKVDDWEEQEIVLSRGEKQYAKDTFELLLGPEGVRRRKQVLEIKEVGYAVRTLKEGWSTEEVKEMVSMFSTAPDKASLSLKDFERLMWEGGLFP